MSAVAPHDEAKRYLARAQVDERVEQDPHDGWHHASAVVVHPGDPHVYVTVTARGKTADAAVELARLEMRSRLIAHFHDPEASARRVNEERESYLYVPSVAALNRVRASVAYRGGAPVSDHVVAGAWRSLLPPAKMLTVGDVVERVIELQAHAHAFGQRGQQGRLAV